MVRLQKMPKAVPYRTAKCTTETCRCAAALQVLAELQTMAADQEEMGGGGEQDMLLTMPPAI